MKIVYTSLVAAGLLVGQNNNAANSTQTVTLESQPIYRVTVVSRTAQAVNYRHRSGATKINFAGTALMPKARGEAKVESKKGYLEVEVEFDEMNPAQKYGPEYLTYVLWAITPEGRAQNMGEILLDSESRGKLNVSTEFQSFGMIVTAEPYFAVSQPSDVVVMENIIRGDTVGKADVIDAKFELLKRGAYVYKADQSALKSMPGDPSKTPLYLWEARNAVQIARWTGADKYAGDSFQKAARLLQQAEDYKTRKQDKPSSMVAREAVQTAEDARLIALERQEQERLANERRAAAEREAAEKAKAAEAQQQQQLEAARRAEAEQNTRLEQARRAQAEAERQAAELARSQAQAERLAAEKAKAEADAARQAAVAQQQELAKQAEAARLAASEADRARLSAEQARANAEQDKERLRQQLLQQFNMILETRDSARGLIVNMSDVLFDTAKYTLRPAAREKLARVGGIVLSHPGLKIEVEGHTDSVGSDEYNQKLSEQRANAVREYLLSQGLQAGSLTSKGFGESTPVASNDTAAGRQQNRRVELVVSGEVIGTKITEIRGTTSAPAPQQ
ncbi:MAG TPA: OmpA family protein [Bryobacteraceae bacterium]|nr:OmpA family protein [Bryobacteraceae bacterium]